MEKRQKKLIIPFIALLVLAILITGIALLVKKYMPSSKEMSLDDYFKVSKGEMQVILQDRFMIRRHFMITVRSMWISVWYMIHLIRDFTGMRRRTSFVYHIDCSDICGGGQQRLLYE